ncbi:MAG: Ig-like domain-containing protein [bacterium]
MIKRFKIIGILLVFFLSAIIGISLYIEQAFSTTAPYFRISASQGQGDGSDEFYVGRCFKVNIYVNTGGYNTNAADVEINYDTSVVQVVQSDCSTVATVLYTDGLYNTYPSQGNSVSTTLGKLYLSAYNNPGVSTNNSNGLYGHYYLKVLTASSSFSSAFEYTQDLTTDTNLAETGGSGTDILQDIDNLSLKLLADTDDPIVTSTVPVSGATGIAVNSNVTFNLYDAMSGINSGSASTRMKVSGGTWYSQSTSAGSQQTTNQNRYYQYSGTVNPNSNIKTNGGYYEYDTTYTVEVTVSDLADAGAHQVVEEWSFATESDDDDPYITNKSPADAATNISTSTNITFRVKDYKDDGGSIPGKGVNSGTITVRVTSASTGENNYTCSSGEITCDTSNINNILVTLDPGTNFAENEEVTVQINASDLNGTPNVMPAETFSFTTEDTAPPTISGFTPTAYSTGNASSTNIVFHVVDSGAGVHLDSMVVYVDNDSYTETDPEFTYSGDSSDYTITINPPTNFTEDRSVVTRITARDMAPSQNYVSPNPTLFTFIVGLTTTTVTQNTTTTVTTTITTDCPACPSCGGGGGPYIFVEKECPPTLTCPTAPVCEAPKACPEIKTDIKTDTKIIYITTSTGQTQQAVDNCFVEIDDRQTGDQTSNWTGQGVSMNANQLPSKITLDKINGKTLPKLTKFLRLLENQKNVELAGGTDAQENTIIQLLIYPEQGSPLIFQTKVDKDGLFNLKLKNIFVSDRYKITSFISDDKLKSKEVKLGSFEIEKKSEGLQLAKKLNQTTEKVYSESRSFAVFIYILIFLTALIVAVLARTTMVGIGSSTIAVLTIAGIVITLLGTETVPKTTIQLSLSEAIAEKTQTITEQEKYQILKEQIKTKLDKFNGQIIDPINYKALDGLVVKLNDKKVEVDQDGKFELVDVYSTDKLKITGSGFNKVLYLELGNKKQNIYHINPQLLQGLANIETYYKQRKFSKVHQFASQELKNRLSVNKFVDDKNQLLSEKIRKYSIVDGSFEPQIEILAKYKADKIGKTYTQVAKVNFVHKGFNETEGAVLLKEAWYFVKTDDGWKFVE